MIRMQNKKLSKLKLAVLKMRRKIIPRKYTQRLCVSWIKKPRNKSRTIQVVNLYKLATRIAPKTDLATMLAPTPCYGLSHPEKLDSPDSFEIWTNFEPRFDGDDYEPIVKAV